MSGWGILAAGLAGGAGAVGGIAEGKIDQERRLESAQVLSDIEEQKQKRIAEYQQQMRRADQTYNTTGQGGQELSAYAASNARQAGGIALELKRNEATDQALIDAQRSKAKGDAEAAHATAKDMAIADANDPAYIGAVTKLKLADPEVAARLAASRAQVAEAGARMGLIGAQTQGVNLSNQDKVQLNKLYSDASEILSDSTIDDAERAKRYMKVQQQIVLMKSKTGQVAGRDPELDTQTVTTTTLDPDTGAETKTTRKEVRKPGQTSPSPAQSGAPPVGAVVGGFTFKGGNPNDKANWEQVGSNPSLPTRKDPITGEELTQGAWDRKYGKGDFKRLYKRGEDALTGF